MKFTVEGVNKAIMINTITVLVAHLLQTSFGYFVLRIVKFDVLPSIVLSSIMSFVGVSILMYILMKDLSKYIIIAMNEAADEYYTPQMVEESLER